MISMASLYERVLNRGEIGGRGYDEQSMRPFKLWLRKAWEESEKGKEYRRALAIGPGEANQ